MQTSYLRRHPGIAFDLRTALLMCLAIAAGVHTSVGAQEPPATTISEFPSDSSVAAILRRWVDEEDGKGIVVGLLESDGRRRIVAVGESGSASGDLDGNTVFEIGSVTKVFTAVLFAEMVRDGEVGLQDPVTKYLPSGVQLAVRNGKAITLLDLVTHHSGLPRMPTNFAPADPSNPYADYAAEQLYDFLSSVELTRDPGAAYQYSNVGMGLLGHLLSLAAGMSYENLLKERVLTPLRLRDTAVTLTADMRSRLARGHDTVGDAAPNWDFVVLQGAGGLRSTANDMLSFLQANIEMRSDRISLALHDALAFRRPMEEAGWNVAFAWEVFHASDREILLHGGGTGGYSSFIGVEPASDRAVVVLSNISADMASIGLHLLDTRNPLGAPPIMPLVGKTVRTSGVEAAIEQYRSLKASSAEAYDFGEGQLNELGYWLLSHDLVSDAVQIFQLNVESFPESYNTYDSLAEAYLAQGDTTAAIVNYRKAVALNAQHVHGIEMLRKIGAPP